MTLLILSLIDLVIRMLMVDGLGNCKCAFVCFGIEWEWLLFEISRVFVWQLYLVVVTRYMF